MATIIRRPDGRFEIRESRSTPEGPRSRTLAIGRELTDELLQHASQRATRPLDRDALIDRARHLGIHHRRTTQPDDVPSLIERARAGVLWPTHRRAIRTVLAPIDDEPLPHHLDAMTLWLGVDDRDRGRALVDLLKLTDAIMRNRPPTRRMQQPLSYPVLSGPRQHEHP